MAAKDAKARSRNAQLGNARRWGNAEEIERLTREVRAAKLQKLAVEYVATWPPLTNEQRSVIAAILAPSSSGEAR